MKKLLKLYRNWRYRRLYLKIFFTYARKGYSGSSAAENAAVAFEWITCQEWGDFILHDYYGVPREKKSTQDAP